MSKRVFSRPVVFAGIGVVALVVAACSGGGSSGPSDTSLSGPSVSAPVDSASLGLIETPNPGGLKVGANIGKLAPNFRLERTDGGTIALSDLRGRPVFLNFWATWCGPCRFEMPELQRMHEKLGDSLAIVAVDLDESRDEVNSFKEDLGLTFPTVIDDGEKVWGEYAPFGLPSTYLIDKDGVIQTLKFGPFVNEADINRSLEEVGLAL